jgi:Glycosyl transferase family 2
MSKNGTTIHPYLISTIDCGHPTIIPHFLRHYLALGIQPERFLITLNAANADDPAAHRATDILRRHGIEHCNLYLGKYNVYDEKSQNFAVKRRYTQPDDWIICCDADEFHQYPTGGAGIGSFLAQCEASGYNVIHGDFVDRISPTGDLNPIEPSRSIWEQFPISCHISGRLGGACTAKVVAHKASINTTLGNHYTEPAESDLYRAYPQRLAVYHFKWDASVIGRLHYHASRLREVHPTVESRRFLEHIEKYGKINLNRGGLLQAMEPLALDSSVPSFYILVKPGEPRTVHPRERFQIEIELRNDTAASLGSHDPYPVHLSYHWLCERNSIAVFDGERTTLLPPLGPQQSHPYTVLIEAPAVEGAYDLRLTLVQEGVRWLDESTIVDLIPVDVHAT